MAENYLPRTKVVMAIRLVEIIKQKEGKNDGVTISDLEKMLTKFEKSGLGFDISQKKLPELLKSADESGQIVPATVFDDKNKPIRAYKVSPIVAPYYDGMLETLGLIERKIDTRIYIHGNKI